MQRCQRRDTQQSTAAQAPTISGAYEVRLALRAIDCAADDENEGDPDPAVEAFPRQQQRQRYRAQLHSGARHTAQQGTKSTSSELTAVREAQIDSSDQSAWN